MAYGAESQAKSAIIRSPCFHSYPVPVTTVSPPPSLADRIEDLLPQTQCTKCGYAGCRPYAEAIATGAASYDQCPPGGVEGVTRLAALLGRPAIALNVEHGVERPRPLARIDEAICIGCTLCIQACPVDAIAGAAKRMHTVIESLCTGCDLCVAPCPVDCIEMIPVTGEATGWQAWTRAQADAARERHDQRLARQQREREAAEHRAALRLAAHQAQVSGLAASVMSSPEPSQAVTHTASQATLEPSGSGTTSDPAPGLASRGTAEPADELADKLADKPSIDPSAVAADERKRAIIQAALERARAKKAELAERGLAPKNTEHVSAAVQAQIDEADARRKRLGIDAGPDSNQGPDPT
jgi:Na+-translocating ferredoxin:NAD+ oxidoreductase subunit B